MERKTKISFDTLTIVLGGNRIKELTKRWIKKTITIENFHLLP
jgi:hypothetical protein